MTIEQDTQLTRSIVNRAGWFDNSFELQCKSLSMVFSGLYGNKVLRRHVRLVFLPTLADLAKTQYTRDDEEPYFCKNVDQHR